MGGGDGDQPGAGGHVMELYSNSLAGAWMILKEVHSHSAVRA